MLNLFFLNRCCLGEHNKNCDFEILLISFFPVLYLFRLRFVQSSRTQGTSHNLCIPERRKQIMQFKNIKYLLMCNFIFVFITQRNKQQTVTKYDAYPYMAISSLTYIMGFSMRFFQPVYSVQEYQEKKNHIKICCSDFWWPTFKIMCNTPIFYQLQMSN